MDYIRRYRLSSELINVLERDLKPYLPKHRRSGGLTNRLKVSSLQTIPTYNRNWHILVVTPILR